MSPWLTVQAWMEFLYLDVVGATGFKTIHTLVSRTRTRSGRHSRPEDVSAVVDAMKTACLLYFKPPACLKRSAVVTRLLRRQGIEADLVIGCRTPPLHAHAWVEVAGEVVSDYQDGLEHFYVLDRW